jgi:type I restriction enzyme M protein
MSNYAKQYIFGIDYGDKASKIARAMMLIAGDGKSHIYKENSLDSFSWSEDIKSDFKKEELLYEFNDFEQNKNNQNTFKYFNFDILMANPPFAGEIVDKKVLSSYSNILTKETIYIKSPAVKNKQFKNLSEEEIEDINKLREAVKTINKENDFASYEEAEEFLENYVRENGFKNISKESLLTFSVAKKIKTFDDYKSAGRDVLFIERNLNFLKPGGRMAIVLPQGRFNNTSDAAVREYIMKEARLIAIVGLDVNSFKPHTPTKTSVLIVQKWNEDKTSQTYSPRIEDYEVFMAVSEKSGKDNSGNEVFKLNEDRTKMFDENGSQILDHDLKEIAESFVGWAKKNNISWVR